MDNFLNSFFNESRYLYQGIAEGYCLSWAREDWDGLWEWLSDYKACVREIRKQEMTGPENFKKRNVINSPFSLMGAMIRSGNMHVIWACLDQWMKHQESKGGSVEDVQGHNHFECKSDNVVAIFTKEDFQNLREVIDHGKQAINRGEPWRVVELSEAQVDSVWKWMKSWESGCEDEMEVVWRSWARVQNLREDWTSITHINASAVEGKDQACYTHVQIKGSALMPGRQKIMKGLVGASERNIVHDEMQAHFEFFNTMPWDSKEEELWKIQGQLGVVLWMEGHRIEEVLQDISFWMNWEKARDHKIENSKETPGLQKRIRRGMELGLSVMMSEQGWNTLKEKIESMVSQESVKLGLSFMAQVQARELTKSMNQGVLQETKEDEERRGRPVLRL